MGQVEIRFEVPDDLVRIVEQTPEELAARARRSLILDLLREGIISQGWAAEFLGVSRHDILDLMGMYHIPSGPLTIEELDAEVAAAEEYIRRQRG